MKYGLHGKLQANKGKGDELAQILLKASAIVSQKPECHLYMVSKDAKDSDCIWVTEVWDDKKSHDESLKMNEVRMLITEAMPYLKDMPDGGSEMNVLGGMGLVDGK